MLTKQQWLDRAEVIDAYRVFPRLLLLSAYAATVEALMGYSLELEELLAGYRATGNANTD